MTPAGGASAAPLRSRLQDATPGTWAAGVISLGLLLAARFYPFDSHPLVVCPLKALARIPCVACGMSRAFVRMAHGEPLQATKVNPLGALLALVAALVVTRTLVLLASGRDLAPSPGPRAAAALRIGVVAALAANWMYLLVTRAAG